MIYKYDYNMILNVKSAKIMVSGEFLTSIKQ